MSILWASLLAICDCGTTPHAMPPINSVKDLPSVAERDAVFRRAGIEKKLTAGAGKEADPDIVYFNAHRESAEQLAARYSWLTVEEAAALKREIAAERRARIR